MAEAKPKPTNPGALPDAFWDSPMQPSGGAKICPGCQNTLTGNSVLCTRCGFDLNKGRALKTRVSKDPGVKSESSGGSKGRFKLPPVFNAPVITTVASLGLIGLFVAAMQDPNMVIFFVAAAAGYALLFQLMVIVLAFVDGEKGWGLWFIASTILGFGPLLIAYFIFFVSDRTELKIMFISSLLAFVGLFWAIMQHGDALKA